jgi:hypothetical protein
MALRLSTPARKLMTKVDLANDATVVGLALVLGHVEEAGQGSELGAGAELLARIGYGLARVAGMANEKPFCTLHTAGPEQTETWSRRATLPHNVPSPAFDTVRGTENVNDMPFSVIASPPPVESRPPDIRGKEVRRITGFHHGFVV